MRHNAGPTDGKVHGGMSQIIVVSSVTEEFWIQFSTGELRGTVSLTFGFSTRS